MRTPRAAHGMVRRMRRLCVCEACDCGADREICAAHAICRVAACAEKASDGTFPVPPPNTTGTAETCSRRVRVTRLVSQHTSARGPPDQIVRAVSHTHNEPGAAAAAPCTLHHTTRYRLATATARLCNL